MSYFCVIRHNKNTLGMIKKSVFAPKLQTLSAFAKAIAHPARLAILEYLAETQTCISGDISANLPLSRSTVSQHLNELKNLGLIHGSIDGLKVNYCLCNSTLNEYLQNFEDFFSAIKSTQVVCDTDSPCGGYNKN